MLQIWQHPAEALAGIVLAFLLQRISDTWGDISVGIQLLITDTAIGIGIDFWQKINFSLLLFGTFLALKKYRKHEIVVVILTVALLPFILATIALAAVLSTPLLPLFTLPIFFISFPRPKRTWPSRVAYNRTYSLNSDTVYYQQALPALMSSLQQTVASGCVVPQAGDQILFRFQDRIVWVSVLEVGSTFFTATFQGLELQETSCHTVEAMKLDSLFESSVSPGIFNPLPFHILQHIETATLRVYSDAKNVMTGIIDQPDNLNRLSDRLIKCLIWVILDFFISGEYKKVSFMPREVDALSHDSPYPHHQSWKASISTSKPQSIQTGATGTVYHKLHKGFSRDSLPYPTISGTLTEASNSINDMMQYDGSGRLEEEEDVWSPLPGLVAPDRPFETMSWDSQSEATLSVAITTVLPTSSSRGQTTFSPHTHQGNTLHDTNKTAFFPANWGSPPLPPSQLNKLLRKFPHEWLHHVRRALGENAAVTDENRKLVERADFCDHFAKLVVTCHSVLEGANSCSNPMQVYHSFKGAYSWSKNIDWISLDPVLNKLVQKSYRYLILIFAVKFPTQINVQVDLLSLL